MRPRLTLYATATIISLLAFATEMRAEYRFRVYLKDKKPSLCLLGHPEQFLSQKAMLRRKKFKLKVDWLDLPVGKPYIKSISNAGASIQCVSKWNNTLLISTPDSFDTARRISQLGFVKGIRPLGKATFHTFPDSISTTRKVQIKDSLPTYPSTYGAGTLPIDQLNGIPLHEAGFRGQGMTIALLDGGFYNADIVKPLQGARIVGTHNFQRRGHNVFEEHSHGLKCLSCMAANTPNTIIGTAPEASYWLIVTEDTYSETMAEEDTWAAGIEFADSVGADVVSSSLGYTTFDDSTQSYKYWQQDGKTSLISHTASIAASRGLLVCNSAGNEGGKTWKRIGFPADASNIITVGAIDSRGVNARFSSVGNTSDGRIKPDVVALGVSSPVVDTDGTLTTANGTSFACPTMAGMVACLMQARPKLKPEQIIRLIQQSSDRAAHPDNVFGYGVPDFWKAYLNSKN